MVTLEEKSEYHQNISDPSSRTMNVGTKNQPTYRADVEIFYRITEKYEKCTAWPTQKMRNSVWMQ